LNFLIGPKLYEADWMQLTNAGYLARVQCAEVWCPMSSLFMRDYLREENDKRRQFLYVMNPNKYAGCEFLMREHEKLGDKILIFSDTVASVEEYGKRLHRHYMYGGTPNSERGELLDRFRMPNGTVNSDGLQAIQTLIISKIGDIAIDLPNANVIIQVSSHFASRRQEAQRLGRILRPKQSIAPGRFNATFYTLISQDTREMMYSSKRRQYLIDQGYAYKVVLWESLFPQASGDIHDETEQDKFLKVVTKERANMKEAGIPEDSM
jgi:DNA excision repair protein ERCC-3